MTKQSNPKQRLLETASELFYRQGYNNTGINQVINEAGVAKASLYQHFGSKEALCVAYLKEKHKNWFEELNQFIRAEDTPKEKILASFDFLESTTKRDDFRGCSFLNILSEVPAASERIGNEAVEHKSKLRSFFKELLNTADQQGNADTIYLLFEAAITESQVYKKVWPIRSAKETVRRLIR
jgi:AcrR family transcriptional regulator